MVTMEQDLLIDKAKAADWPDELPEYQREIFLALLDKVEELERLIVELKESIKK
jgi:hypothetical protein